MDSRSITIGRPVQCYNFTAPLTIKPEGNKMSEISERLAAAVDRLEIMELSARFDNALDRGDAESFAAVFTPNGILAGFWGESVGHEQIRQAHAFMLSTFSKDKRHVVTNHEIEIEGQEAKLFCYLTVFDRNALAVTGTATFTDDVIWEGGRWLFRKRTLAADRNVDPIIASLRSAG